MMKGENGMNGIVLEGVTGGGKSQTLAALERHPRFSALLGAGRVYREEETLGEVMDELGQMGVPPSKHLWRLENVMAELARDAEDGARRGYVLERFHWSYYSLLPDWNLYRAIDAQLAGWNFRTVLLTIAPEDFVGRSLERADRDAVEWTEGMIAFYGSRDKVLEAMRVSQARRIEAVRLSAMRALVIDTSAKAWDRYAEQIVAFWHDKLVQE